MNEIFNIIIRSIIIIFTLFIVTKILGKKQVAELTLYDYVIGITIGSIAGDSIITLDESLINGIVSLLVFGIIGYGLSYLAIKSHDANDILNGKATILMENGKFNFDNMQSTKITIAKFIEEARLKGYFDISILNYAILETNGQISFLTKEEYQNTNTADFKTNIKSKVSKQTMCRNVIVEGIIDLDVLKYFGKNKEWLKKELKSKGILKSDDVLLATIDDKLELIIY